MSRRYTNVLGVGLYTCAFGFLFQHSLDHSSIHVAHYLSLMLLAWGFYFYLAATKCTFTLKQIIWAALFFRIIAIFTNPLMEDDYYRYLWNGYQLIEHGNVRSSAPMAFFDAELPENMEQVLSGINNPHLASIYSPLVEYVFALAYIIYPAKLIVIKLVYLIIEAVTFCWVYKLLDSKKLLLILWNPLIIFETYVNAHPDILAMCFLLLVWVCFKKQNYLLLGIFLGLAFGSRLFILIALPLMFVSLRSVLGFLISTTLVYGSFMFIEKSFGSIAVFLNNWEFNSSVFGLLRAISGYHSAQLICAVSVCLFLFVFWGRYFKQYRVSQDSVTRNVCFNLDVLFMVFFLFMAVFNPWYCAVFIPFIVINDRKILLFIPWALSLSYIHGLNLPSPELDAYEIPVAVLIIEYSIIYLCLYWSFKKDLYFDCKIEHEKV